MRKGWKKFFLPTEERRLGQLVQIHARREVYMEGCKRVLHCDENRICIQGAFLMTVEGEGLILKEMGNDVLCACGTIRSVGFGE